MSLVVLSYPACTGVIWSSVSSRWVCTLMLEERIVWWVDATMLLYIFLSIVSLSAHCCHQFEKDSFLPSFFPHSGPSDSVHEAEKVGQKKHAIAANSLHAGVLSWRDPRSLTEAKAAASSKGGVCVWVHVCNVGLSAGKQMHDTLACIYF